MMLLSEVQNEMNKAEKNLYVANSRYEKCLKTILQILKIVNTEEFSEGEKVAKCRELVEPFELKENLK